jgi:HSP20 family protein
MLRRWYDIERQFVNDFNEALRAFDRVQRAAHSAARTEREPDAQLYDAGDHLELLAEVPGLAQQDIHIQLQSDVLSLRYERPNRAPEGYSVHRQERPAFKVSQSFTLPCEVDPDKTSASLKDGLLTVRLWKAPLHQPRQIPIQIA